MKSISVVIPVYNGEATIPELAARLANVLPSAADSFEIVMVNDGSRDGSWAAIVELARAHNTLARAEQAPVIEAIREVPLG